MKFKRYTSIENHYRLKYLLMIKNHPDYKEDSKWSVTEKIHGANMSIWYDGEEFKIAKRSGWITKDSNFYCIGNYWDELKEKTKILFDLIKNGTIGKVEYITIYGEWFGGSFPGIKSSKYSKKVQKGVYYSPENHFYGFDIAVNDMFTDVIWAEDLLKKSNFLYAQSLFEGTLDECLLYGNKFNSTIPHILGHKLPDDIENICEGIVIRPNIPMFIEEEGRVIIKSKNDLFKEVQKEKKEKVPLSDEVIKLSMEINNYITEQRLYNVMSKIGISPDDLDFKHIGQILPLYVKDVMEEFEKDTNDSLDTSNQKIINKYISSKAAVLIKKELMEV